MSLIENMRQKLEEAAVTAREVGQNLGAQAQSQLNIKKLEFEHSKKLRDLGEASYNWYKAGKMVVSGPVPENVRNLCAELDESSTRLQLEEARLEETKRQAEQRTQNKEQTVTYTVLPTPDAIFSVDDGTNSPNSNATSANAHNGDVLTESAHGGVTIPGTGIHVSPTPAVPEVDDVAPSNANAPIEDGIPAIPASDLSGGNLPAEPASDISPLPGGSSLPASPGMPSSPAAPGGFGPATM